MRSHTRMMQINPPDYVLHRYGDFFGRTNNIEWWNDGMAEYRPKS